jgi:hypothetical protein
MPGLGWSLDVGAVFVFGDDTFESEASAPAKRSCAGAETLGMKSSPTEGLRKNQNKLLLVIN